MQVVLRVIGKNEDFAMYSPDFEDEAAKTELAEIAESLQHRGDHLVVRSWAVVVLNNVVGAHIID